MAQPGEVTQREFYSTCSLVAQTHDLSICLFADDIWMNILVAAPVHGPAVHSHILSVMSLLDRELLTIGVKQNAENLVVVPSLGQVAATR